MSQSAIVLKDRVKETTTTTGTGTITLAGAAPGFVGFSAIGTGSSTYYTIVDGTAWEVGIGYYQQGTSTLTRDTVLSSSNAGAKLDLGVGTKEVFVTLPGDQVLAGVAWSEPIVHTMASGDPASGNNYYYPCIVYGASPFYISVTVSDGSTSQTIYQKVLALSGGEETPVSVMGNDYSTAWVNNIRVYYNASGFGARAGVGMYFAAQPPIGYTVSVRIGYLPSKATYVVPVKVWSTSSSAPTAYTSAGLSSSTAYTRSTSSRGSKWAGDGAGLTNIGYASSSGSSNYATTSGSTQALQGYAVSTAAPMDNYVLTWDAGSSSWQPEPAAGGGGGVTSIIAGTGISISSTGPGGTGDVTINASGGGGGGNPVPAGIFGVTLHTGVLFTTGYVAFPSNFVTSGFLGATLSCVIVTSSASQPVSTPFPFSYNGWYFAFFGGLTYYVHEYICFDYDFGSLDPNGFYLNNVPMTSATALVFLASQTYGSGNGGYGNGVGSGTGQSTPLAFQPVSPPPSGTFTVYDSKQIVFYESPATLTALGAGVTVDTTEDGPIKVSVVSVPSALVPVAPAPAENTLTYSGAGQAGVVDYVGYTYEP